MSAYTLSVADIRDVGMSDYATRSVMCDPSLDFETRFGPKGGGGRRYFEYRQVLRILRDFPKFTPQMQTELATIDQSRRLKGKE